MRFSLALIGAAAQVVSAIKFGSWLQTNGLVQEYYNFVRFTDIIQTVEAQDSVTVFIPSDNAWKWWQDQPTVANNSFEYNRDTMLYMVVKDKFTVKDLETHQTLTTLLDGETVKSTTTGIYPDLTVYILSGTGYTSNATVGVYNQDFNIDNGHVQLVNNVFKLPTSIGKTAQQSKTQIGAASTSFGSVSLLACAGVVGLMALL